MNAIHDSDRGNGIVLKQNLNFDAVFFVTIANFLCSTLDRFLFCLESILSHGPLFVARQRVFSAQVLHLLSFFIKCVEVLSYFDKLQTRIEHNLENFWSSHNLFEFSLVFSSHESDIAPLILS